MVSKSYRKAVSKSDDGGSGSRMLMIGQPARRRQTATSRRPPSRDSSGSPTPSGAALGDVNSRIDAPTRATGC